MLFDGILGSDTECLGRKRTPHPDRSRHTDGRAHAALLAAFYPGGALLADEQPKRVKILGEDLVPFRDSDSRPVLIANAYPHRGAPLMF